MLNMDTRTIRLMKTMAGVGVALLTATLPSAPAAAQINVENFAQVGFNFSAPGARSAAMGGAFIALADDATAAETNPAGLTTLLRPEVSFEFKGVEYTRTVPPAAGGEPETGTEFNDRVAIPSFASIVLPVGRMTLGVFRHELVNYRSRTYGEGYLYEDDQGDSFSLFPYTTDLQMLVENYGGALALQMGPMSLGVAGGMSRLTMELEYLRYQVQRFQPAYLANQVIVAPEDGSQTGYFVNAGVLIRPSERFAIGGVYRLRPKFSEMRLQSLDAMSQPFDETPDTLFTVNVPDAIGAGITMRPHDLLTLSVDAVWNRYSQVADTMSFTFVGSGADTLVAEDFVADDGIDYRGGAELIVLVGQTYFALRGGASYTAPSNTYYLGERDATQLLWGTEPTEPVLSYTAGIGTQLFGLLQIDTAATMSEERAEVVISAVMRFGR